MKSTRFLSILVAVLLGAIFTDVFASSEKLTLVIQDKEVSYTLGNLKNKLKVHSVTIDDPNYKKVKQFDGFEVLEIFKLAGIDPGTVKGEILFSCKDGYSPSISFDKFLKYKAYLAFQETGKSKPPFEKILAGKISIDPAPFYLVWENSKNLEPFIPWPDQLIRIEIVQFAKKFPNVFPHTAQPDSGAYRGFLLFKSACFRCHTINLEGGDIGPELNAPQNITEYRKEKTIREFITNSQSFRYRSRMPPFPQLTEKELDDLLDYLRFMKDFKIQQ